VARKGRLTTHWLTIPAVLASAGCGGDGACSLLDPCGTSSLISSLDLDRFESTPAFAELDFSMVRLARDFDHWQVRMISSGGFDVFFRGGPLPEAELSPEIREALDTVRVVAGFDNQCLPVQCGRYFISVLDEDVRVWNSREKARDFFGPVEGVVEAIVLTRAEHFNLNASDKRRGSIRETDDGFLVLATERVSLCDPFQIDRVLLEISPSAEFAEVARETIERTDECFII